MANYFLRIEGPSRARTEAVSQTLAEVRSEAVRYLGAFLSEHPDFAEEGHWRLMVENEAGSPLFHVIVATVPARNGTADVDGKPD